MVNNTENSKQIKFGAVACCYNREWYIGPFLEQMTGFGIECIVALSNIPYVNEGKDEDKEPDRSEGLCRKYFPDVRIIKGNYPHHRDSINAGIESLQNCDIIFIMDCDMFLTKEDWVKCFNFIESNYANKYNVYKVNFENMILEYYHDYNYGKSAKVGGHPPIIAVNKNIRVKSMVYADNSIDCTWDDPSIKIHHLRFCKGKYGNTGDLYMKPPQSALEDYRPAPGEIINRFKTWEKILETL